MNEKKIHVPLQHAFETLKGPALQKLCAEASKPFQSKVGIFVPVQEFLQNAGQTHLVEQVWNSTVQNNYLANFILSTCKNVCQSRKNTLLSSLFETFFFSFAFQGLNCVGHKAFYHKKTFGLPLAGAFPSLTQPTQTVPTMSLVSGSKCATCCCSFGCFVYFK